MRLLIFIVCSFHNSNLLIAFVIDFEDLCFDWRWYWMNYYLVLYFIFCISIIHWSFMKYIILMKNGEQSILDRLRYCVLFWVEPKILIFYFRLNHAALRSEKSRPCRPPVWVKKSIEKWINYPNQTYYLQKEIMITNLNLILF